MLEPDEAAFPHKDVTEAIIGAAFEVYIIWATATCTGYIKPRYK